MSAKRKGVSAEEKRTRMLQLFYEKQDFFQLKELEKIAPKEKGIIAQSVKDVVQNLVDDGLVDTDKIGTSVYYWAFPNKAKHSRKRKIEELRTKLEERNKALKRVRENIISCQVGREDTSQRREILSKLSELEAEEAELKKKIQSYQDSDPEIVEQLKSQIEIAKTAANRWTDNIFAVKSWCKKKFFIEGKELDKQFGIPSDLDYID